MSEQHALPEKLIPVVNGLLKEAASRAGRILLAQAAIAKDEAELGALHSAIKVLAPDVKLDSVKPRPPRTRRQDTSGPVLNVLREAHEPLTARQIAEMVMSVRGHSVDDLQAAQATLQQVQQVLTSLSKNEVIKAASDKRPKAWSIV